MSRHRNVRSMKYSDEYDGYDDVYGHSVEEDCALSPSDAAFMFDRSVRPQFSSFLRDEEDIAEEDEQPLPEGDAKFAMERLNETDQAKLLSCLEEIRNVIGDTVQEQTAIEVIIAENYDLPKALDVLLNSKLPPVAPTLAKQEIIDVPKPQRLTSIRSERGLSQPMDSDLEVIKLKRIIRIAGKENEHHFCLNRTRRTKVLRRGRIKKVDMLKGLVQSEDEESDEADSNEGLVKKVVPTHALQNVHVSKLGYYLCQKAIKRVSHIPKLPKIERIKIFCFDTSPEANV